MKKIILSAIISIAAICTASAQRGFNFQGVSQEKDKDITVVFEFINTSNDEVRYSEQHTAKTNADGIFSVVMGKGEPLIEGSNFSWVWWDQGEYKLRTSINGEVIATTEFHAVPYAKVAEKLEYPDDMTMENRERIVWIESMVAEVQQKLYDITQSDQVTDQIIEIVRPYVDATLHDRIYMETEALKDSITEQKERINSLEKECVYKQDQIDALNTKCSDLQTMIDRLEKMMDKLQNEVDNMKDEK